MEPIEILVLCILLLIIVILFAYIIILKMQIRSFNKKIKKLLDQDYDEIIKVDVFDKDVTNLASTMNKHVFRQRKLASDYIADRDALNNLVSGISHDFRTPLTASIGYLQMIERSGEIKDPKYKEYLKIALDKNIFLNKLSDDFFDISKMGSGAQREVNIEKFCISSVVEDRILEQFNWISERGIEPKISIEPEVFIEADRHDVDRIIDNLFSNCKKYAVSKLKVTLTKDSLSVSNLVADEAEINTAKMFEPFYRGVSRNKEGSGLGLYVVKCICDEYEYGLDVTLKNKEFTITIKFGK